MTFPPYLKKGDTIGITCPAGYMAAEKAQTCINTLQDWGYEVMIGKTLGSDSTNYFSGTDEERLDELQAMLDDREIKAILFGRGGYGVGRIIDKLDFTKFKKNPKWLIGFSDITILHQALLSTGFISIHGIMAKQLTELPAHSEALVLLENILKGKTPSYKIIPDAKNRPGTAKGKLIGGNLSVFMGMRGTKFDLSFKNSILFIEDVGEKPYQVDRMLQNLRISGALSQLSGLLVGQFTEYEEDPDMKKSLHQIISDAVKDYDYPVCFNFSAGHIDQNFPLLMGATAELTVEQNGAVLSFQTTFWKKAEKLLNL